MDPVTTSAPRGSVPEALSAPPAPARESRSGGDPPTCHPATAPDQLPAVRNVSRARKIRTTTALPGQCTLVGQPEGGKGDDSRGAPPRRPPGAKERYRIGGRCALPDEERGGAGSEQARGAEQRPAGPWGRKRALPPPNGEAAPSRLGRVDGAQPRRPAAFTLSSRSLSAATGWDGSGAGRGRALGAARPGPSGAARAGAAG